MTDVKLKVADIPYWRNLTIYPDIYENMILSGKWFDMEEDSPVESITETVYTSDREEYEWHCEFCKAVEWLEDHEDQIKQAFRKELGNGRYEVDSLFNEFQDFIDRLPEIQKRVKQYLSRQ